MAADASRVLTLERISYDSGMWARVEPVWRSLLIRARRRSAFVSAEWMGAWIEEFGPALRPTTLIWRDREGRPVGCVLISEAPARLGPFSVDRLFLNASGDGHTGCEHNDLVVLPEFHEVVLDDLVRVFRESNADEISLVGMRKDSARALASRWASGPSGGFFSEAPYVPLGRLRREGIPYVSRLSANTRSQVRRSIRLYEERFGPGSLEVAGPGEVADWFEQLVSLHEKRWNGRGQPGAFASPSSRRFHTSVLERGVGVADPNRLGIDVVRVRFGDTTIGFLYDLRFGGRVSFYQSGLSYHSDKRLKPGLVTHVMAIEHYAASGAEEYDFLGGESEGVRYKRSLSTEVRELAWIRLPAPSLKMQVLGGLGRVRRRARSAWTGRSQAAVPSGPGGDSQTV